MCMLFFKQVPIGEYVEFLKAARRSHRPGLPGSGGSPVKTSWIGWAPCDQLETDLWGLTEVIGHR